MTFTNPLYEYGKEAKPWNPVDSGIYVINVKTKQIITSCPFHSIDVYANKDDDYIVWDRKNNEYLISGSSNLGTYMFRPVNYRTFNRIPKEIHAMVLLLKD